MALKLFVRIQSCYKPSYIILRSMVPELHALRMVCLLGAVAPAWVTNTVLFSLVVDFTRYFNPFDILQARVKCQLSVGPACLKQTLLREWWTD